MGDLPLRVRIVIAFAVVLGMGAASLMVVYPRQMHAVELEWAERRAIALATAVGDSADAGLDFGDAKFVTQCVAGMARFPDAIYAFVVTDDGTVLGQWGTVPRTTDVVWTQGPETNRHGDQLEVRVPMTGKAGAKGVLVAAFDQTALERQHDANTNLLAWALGGMWVLGIAVSWIMGTLLVQPLREVTQAARSFGHGQEGTNELLASLRTAQGQFRRDEARVLAQAFFGMMGRIRAQVAELEQQRGRAMTAEEEALRASAAKSQFLANMSHELRTPLNAIIGYCELITDDVEGGDPTTVVSDLAPISISAKHLLSLINDVLDLSKIEADRLELLVEPYNLGAMLADVAAEVDPLVRRNSNRLELHLPPDLPPVVGDEMRLRQCVLNLVSNAAKFTKDGVIGIDLAWEGRNFSVAVTDTGTGIAPDTLARLFQPFVQADASTTRRVGGTGLGLALTRRLCQLMGGDVEVCSRPGVGSVFTLRLPMMAPVATGRPAPTWSSTSATEASSTPGRSPT